MHLASTTYHVITVSLATQLIELMQHPGAGGSRNRGARSSTLPEAELKWSDIVYFRGADDEAREVPLLFLYCVQATRGGPAPVLPQTGRGKAKAPPEPHLAPSQGVEFMAAMELCKRVKAVVFVRSGTKAGELKMVDPALLVKAAPPGKTPKDALEDEENTRQAFKASDMAGRLPTAGGSVAFGSTSANLPYADHTLLLNGVTFLVSKPACLYATASVTPHPDPHPQTSTLSLTPSPQPSSQSGKQGGSSTSCSDLGQDHEGGQAGHPSRRTWPHLLGHGSRPRLHNRSRSRSATTGAEAEAGEN